MRVTLTSIKDCYIVSWDKIEDERGYFQVPFNSKEFKDLTDIDFKIIQENESFSSKNVIRGLHFQKPPFEQAKLVRCVYGNVTDVIVDIRKDSPSYGEVVKVELNGGSTQSVFVPRGCAHGFSTHTRAIFNYKVDNLYSKDSEGGIIYNDPDLNIDWGVKKNPKISEKDLTLPFFKELDIY
jgi:dTDP-4-dehydrorhamnose 3,5-epimerase